MTFANAARKVVSERNHNKALHATLRYLLKVAVGRKNAVCWERLQAHLATRGVQLNKKTFQQTVLKETRSGKVFIGSNNKGYFLIDSADDAIAMQRFYEDRIAAEKHHLDHLIELAGHSGWDLRTGAPRPRAFGRFPASLMTRRRASSM